MHVHAFQGVTSVDDGHSHEVANTTAQAPDINGEEMVTPEPIPEPLSQKGKYPKR
jgi:hypothetical protein